MGLMFLFCVFFELVMEIGSELGLFNAELPFSSLASKNFGGGGGILLEGGGGGILLEGSGISLDPVGNSFFGGGTEKRPSDLESSKPALRNSDSCCKF